ncbi:MAG: protein kinase [bacterium]|nr:protein kinase [bacterium]
MSQELSGLDLQRLGHYEIVNKVAEGGFGVVYNARDTRLGRNVAVKVLHPYHASDPTRVARFVREARSAAKLQHPGIVQVFDIIESEGRMALVMEFIDGMTLDAYLKENPKLTLADKIEIGAQIADTLDVAHKAGVIHRDVKPANVMIDGAGRVKLTDFSLARLLDSSMTQLTGENNVMGTPAYMSPEQCEGTNAAPQSDLYSLGIIVYEMATGHVPFEAENYLALLRHHTDTPPTPVRLLKPSLPVVLEGLIMQCLSKDPAKRPASGMELAAALREIAQTEGLEDGPSADAKPNSDVIEIHRPVTASPKTPSSIRTLEEKEADDAKRNSGVWRKVARKPWPVKAGAVAVVLVMAFVAWRVFSGGEGAETVPTVGGLFSASPLQDYVRAEDDNYRYDVYAEMPGDGYTAHVLDMTSQTWHADKVKPPVWRHWVTLIVPARVTSKTALLVCTEGLSTADEPLTEIPESLASIATTTKSIVAVFEGFPRSPMGFLDDNDEAPDTEPDELAVATFEQFIDTGDATWPIVCPLVKSTVRAMDTVQAYGTDELRLEQPIENFVLTGSANGWGVWLTGAVDTRVSAIAPVEFDLLNIDAQIDHQIGLRGAPSRFLQLFSDMNVMPALDTKEGEDLLSIIDPYAYRDRLNMPKLILMPACDSAYATVDAASLFVDDLKGPTYLLYMPNTEPSEMPPLLAAKPVEAMAEEGPSRGDLMMTPPARADLAKDAEQHVADIQDALHVFYHRMLVDKPMPEFAVADEPAGSYEMSFTDQPSDVRLWVAESSTRDFRHEVIGSTWFVEKLKPNLDGEYKGKINAGKGKYCAFYIELVYPSKLNVNYRLTSAVTVLEPDGGLNRLASLAGSVHQYN